MPERTAETVPGVTRWRPRKVVEAIQIPGFVSDAVEAFTDGTHLEWELDDAALLLGVVMRLDPLSPVVGRLATGDWIVRVPGTPRFAGYGAAEFAAKFEPAAGSPISATLGVLRSQVMAALEDWDGQGSGDPADAVMAAVTPGLESILSALQAGAAGISGPGAGDEPSGADTGPQEAAEPLLPPGEYARVEIMGHDSEYGFVTERTRAGVLVMVISDWNGRVKAEIPGQSLYKFVPAYTAEAAGPGNAARAHIRPASRGHGSLPGRRGRIRGPPGPARHQLQRR